MASPTPQLVYRLPTIKALREALPSLEKRRAFVPEASGVSLRQHCELVLVHPEADRKLSIGAEVVWVQPDGAAKGIGVELRELDVAGLRAFVENAVAAAPGAPEAEDENGDRAKSLYDKIRGFSAREREVCARSGALTERVALERCYGSSVWEALLHNPQLTAPEVARIAKNGTVSVPLLAVIVANGAWLAVGEVQRALLGNPRLSVPQIDRVLGAMPASNLRTVAQQTAYRAPVRQAAQRLLKR